MIVLFLQKRDTFPVLYVNFLWITFLVHVMVLVLFQSVKGEGYSWHNGGNEMIGKLFAAVVWTIYLKKSDRVRRTFVQNHGRRSFNIDFNQKEA